ncbi:hypothetical protein E3N88_15640 [Mikania micrantha]|uniref:Uncharacterized protein n=1 Tax=Mikania micrantha TaxID=192012 RepID=A0A5N6NVZ8_9ASTR|nr:hypothetical protein E3N88_15640 [Mikania micrantha]
MEGFTLPAVALDRRTLPLPSVAIEERPPFAFDRRTPPPSFQTSLYRFGVKMGAFELTVVEGGNRNIRRVNTSNFGDDRIEMGPTWIHGVVCPYHLKVKYFLLKCY